MDTFFSYVELIPPNVALPCKATRTLESALDHLKSTDIPVCNRTSMLHIPTQITHMTLNDLWIAKKEDTKPKVQMEIGKDRAGSVTAIKKPLKKQVQTLVRELAAEPQPQFTLLIQVANKHFRCNG